MILENMFVLLFTDYFDTSLSPMEVYSLLDCARLSAEIEDCSSFFCKEDSRSCFPSLTRPLDKGGLSNIVGYRYYAMRPDCDSTWAVIKSNHCYYIGSPGLAADAAHDACVSNGGFLAKIESPEEYALVLSLRYKYNTGFWIGGTDMDNEGTWLWRDGTPVTHFYWVVSEGQPDAATPVDDCIEQWAYKDGCSVSSSLPVSEVIYNTYSDLQHLWCLNLKDHGPNHLT